MIEERRFVLHRDKAERVQGVIQSILDNLRERYKALGDGQALEIIVRPKKRNRSLSQNRLFHQWMNEIAAHVAEHYGQQYPPEAWKEWLKTQYLGQEVHTMPNGQVIAYTRHTSSLSVDEFTHLLEQIDAWAAQEIGCQLTHPTDIWDEAMGRDRNAA